MRLGSRRKILRHAMTSWLPIRNTMPFLIRKIWRCGWISVTAIFCSGMPSMTGKPSSSAAWPDAIKRGRHVAEDYTERLKRLACVMPVFISTFHSLPKYMVCADNGEWDAPLYDAIDLLIVDESGGRYLPNWQFRLSALPSKLF